MLKTAGQAALVVEGLAGQTEKRGPQLVQGTGRLAMAMADLAKGIAKVGEGVWARIRVLPEVGAGFEQVAELAVADSELRTIRTMVEPVDFAALMIARSFSFQSKEAQPTPLKFVEVMRHRSEAPKTKNQMMKELTVLMVC